ncbi:MAG: T6SS immunity protein Tli4 family protein [Bdellovibrionales bacterium]
MYLTILNDDLAKLITDSERTTSSKITQILKYGINPKSPTIKEYPIPKLGPAAWIGLGDIDSFERRLVAIKGDIDNGLRLELLSAKGREQAAEKALIMISSKYNRNDKSGFCLEIGSITGPASSHEQVSILLESLDSEIVFDTRKISEKNQDHPFKYLNLALALQEEFKLISKKKEKIGDRAGETLRYRIKNSEGSWIYESRYFYTGQPKDSIKPEISISMSGPFSKKDELDQIWKKFLTSIKPNSL